MSRFVLASEKRNRWKPPLAVAGLLAGAGLVVLIVAHVSVYRVAGRSMETTYAAGDLLLIESLTFRFRPPKRFEVVVLRDPANSGQLELKRVVGLPGETVEAKERRLLIDGRELVPPGGLTVPQWFGPHAAGDGYFLLGDNTAESRDSRTFGSVMPGCIVGRVAAALKRKAAQQQEQGENAGNRIED